MPPGISRRRSTRGREARGVWLPLLALRAQIKLCGLGTGAVARIYEQWWLR